MDRGEAGRHHLSEPWPGPRRVMVATDGGAASIGAERAALDLAARSGASLIVMSVIDPSRLRSPGGLFHTRVDQVRAEREVVLGRLVDKARGLGIRAQFLIWEGDPGSGVIEAAGSEDADVVVLGSHARGAIGRRLLGSVSTHVVAHARQRVLVVRPDQRLDEVWPLAGGPAGAAAQARRGVTAGSR